MKSSILICVLVAGIFVGVMGRKPFRDDISDSVGDAVAGAEFESGIRSTESAGSIDNWSRLLTQIIGDFDDDGDYDDDDGQYEDDDGDIDDDGVFDDDGDDGTVFVPPPAPLP